VNGSTPTLERVRVGDTVVLTDAGLRRDDGVVVAFTERTGGESLAPFESLNLAAHVGDEASRVDSNRSSLLAAVGLSHLRSQLVTAEQVHGTHIHEVTRADAGRGANSASELRPVAGTDALITRAPGIPLMLFYADCVPVILVAPRGSGVAVVHAGWRGALAQLPGATLIRMALTLGVEPSSICAYIGPCIRSCCYEVDETLLSQFVHEFGTISAVEGRLDLVAVVRESLHQAGLLPEMIADCGVCTLDHVDRFFSYRANATTGRHAALAAITKVE